MKSSGDSLRRSTRYWNALCGGDEAENTYIISGKKRFKKDSRTWLHKSSKRFKSGTETSPTGIPPEDNDKRGTPTGNIPDHSPGRTIEEDTELPAKGEGKRETVTKNDDGQSQAGVKHWKYDRRRKQPSSLSTCELTKGFAKLPLFEDRLHSKTESILLTDSELCLRARNLVLGTDENGKEKGSPLSFDCDSQLRNLGRNAGLNVVKHRAIPLNHSITDVSSTNDATGNATTSKNCSRPIVHRRRPVNTKVRGSSFKASGHRRRKKGRKLFKSQLRPLKDASKRLAKVPIAVRKHPPVKNTPKSMTVSRIQRDSTKDTTSKEQTITHNKAGVIKRGLTTEKSGKKELERTSSCTHNCADNDCGSKNGDAKDTASKSSICTPDQMECSNDTASLGKMIQTLTKGEFGTALLGRDLDDSPKNPLSASPPAKPSRNKIVRKRKVETNDKVDKSTSTTSVQEKRSRDSVELDFQKDKTCHSYNQSKTDLEVETVFITSDSTSHCSLQVQYSSTTASLEEMDSYPSSVMVEQGSFTSLTLSTPRGSLSCPAMDSQLSLTRSDSENSNPVFNEDYSVTLSSQSLSSIDKIHLVHTFKFKKAGSVPEGQTEAVNDNCCEQFQKTDCFVAETENPIQS